MSWSTKLKRLHIPSYAVVAIMAFAAAGSLWLPRLLNKHTEVALAAYRAVSFSTPTTVVATVPSNAYTRVLYASSTYYIAFTSSSGANHNVYVTKSTNNGASWSSPVLAFSNLFLENSANPHFTSFVYNSVRNELAIVTVGNGTGFAITTSSLNASSWSSPTTIVAPPAGAGHILGRSAFGFSTSTGIYAVAYAASNTIQIATSSAGVTWTTSTISQIGSTYDSNALAYVAYPLALDVRGNTIQVIYDMSIVTPSTAYELVYASSTNLGTTWTTSTITGQIPSPSAQVSGLAYLSSAAFDRTGNPGVVYYSLSAINVSTLTQTSTPVYAVKNGATWTTSTFHGGALSYGLGSGGESGATALTYFSSNYPLIAYINNSGYSAFAANTSSAFTTTTVVASSLQLGSYQSIVYSTTTQQVATVFVTGSALKISTSTLRDTTINNAPSASVAVTPTFSTSGNGYLTVTGTMTDTDVDLVSFTVEHSVDGGATWASSTLATATSSLSSSLTKSAGLVSNIILNSNGTQSFTFVFDTQANSVTSTSQFQIRLTPFDDLGLRGSTLTSANMTVDNVAPSAPSTFNFTLATSSIAISWSDVSGTSNYTVSSTAGTATTTSATTTSYTSLTPNTAYSFQVKGTDAYSNVGSFSAVTTTYTNPNAPTTVAATSNGSASLIVTWSANSNGTGTVYQLLNVTASSTVATTTATTYTVTGLSASTNYQFAVRAQYLADGTSYSVYSSTSTAVSTDAAASSGGGGGGSGAVTVTSPAPVVVSAAPVTPVATVQPTFSLNVPTPVSVGASSHTVTVASASVQSITMTIQSDPITVTLKVNETRELDTNKDGINDLRATYLGLSAGKPQVKFVTLADEGELKNTFTINAGAYQTNSQKVQLMFNSSDSVQMAISNTADFAGSSFTSFAKQVDWTLPAGNGAKTVYVRLRSGSGGMVTVSDSIELVGSSAVVEQVPVKIDTTPVQTPVKAVVSIKHRRLASGSRGADVVAVQTLLKDLGFFPKTVKPNGQFGPTTIKAVKAFQKAHKISAVGYIGPATWAELDSMTSIF